VSCEICGSPDKFKICSFTSGIRSNSLYHILDLKSVNNMNSEITIHHKFCSEHLIEFYRMELILNGLRDNNLPVVGGCRRCKDILKNLFSERGHDITNLL
jgi:hypothetical protein